MYTFLKVYKFIKVITLTVYYIIRHEGEAQVRGICILIKVYISLQLNAHAIINKRVR